MKLPWISREAHDAIVAGLNAQIRMTQDIARQWAELASDYSAKIDQLTAPKVEAVSPGLVLEPREPNIITQTIRELAQGDQRLAQFLHGRKRELRQEHPHMSDEGIADLLGTWETSDDMFEETA